MKLILWLLLGFLVLYVLRKKSKSAYKAHDAQARAQPRSTAAGKVAQAAPAETMLLCAQCGVHLPESEAVQAESGQIFCSEEHRRLHTGR